MALIAYYNFREFSDFEVIAFTLDPELIKLNTFENLPVIPFNLVEKKFRPREFYMFVAIGYIQQNQIREAKYTEAKEKKYRLINFIHPSVSMFSDLRLGDNCFISANTSIQPKVIMKNNIVIGDNCCIGHNSKIGNNCYIGGGTAIAGNVNIGKNVFTGKNATLRDNINIGSDCIIGAGVTMLKNANPGEVYISPEPIKYPFNNEGLI